MPWAKEAHVVAHFGGGPIAVQLAIDAHEAVRSLVLLEPALHSAQMAAAFHELIAPLVEMHHTGNSAKAAHLWMRSVAGSNWRSNIEQLLPGAADQANRDAAGTFDYDLAAMRRWAFDAVGAQRLTKPVLYIVGSRSASRVENVTVMFRAAVPDAYLVVIPDADHTLQLTRPRPVADAIAAFLRQHTI